MSILFYLIRCSILYSQKSNVEITKEYQRIDSLKTLTIDDSLSLTRGIDFNQGSNVDEVKYNIFREKRKIIKKTDLNFLDNKVHEILK